MAKEHDCCGADNKYWMKRGCDGGGGAVYGLGLIGALVYFLGKATTFGAVVIGILKSLVWPTYFVYYIFKSLGL